MLYLVGLGLYDEEDMSLRAVNILKRCDSVYCEFYTGKWHGDLKKLEKISGKKIEVLPRKKVESDFLVDEAKASDVALLVPGDPLTATTHIELMISAKKQSIGFSIIHSSSVYTAVAESGLLLYKFGRATTLVCPEKGYEPKSPYDVIKENRKAGLHTLVLLDIKNDKLMTVKEATGLLTKNGAINKEERIVACSCLGSKEGKIEYNTASALREKDLPVPSAILVPGKLNFKEEEALELWKN